MEYTAELVLVKTQKGADELVSRRNGLNPRVRQLLILIDGQRNFATLGRMVGEKEISGFASALESAGFIARQSSPTLRIDANDDGELVEIGVEPPALQASGTATHTQRMASYTAQANQVLHPTRTVAATVVEFPAMRQKITRALNDLLGPFADDINVRVEKTKSLQDLRDLQPAIAGVVEAVRGKSAMNEFVNKIGKF